MVGRSRFSLRLLMVIILMFAVDFALVRQAWGHADSSTHSSAFFAIVLPMANLLVLVLPRCRRSSESWPFWWGFEVFAWVVIGVIAYGDLHAKEILFAPIEWFANLHLLPINSTPNFTIGLGFCVLFYTPPQLLIATLGGWIVAFLTSRFRQKQTSTTIVD